MRCPKCGYISFDNVGTCLKCKKDISAATNAFQGSTYNVTNPSFLKFDDSEEDIEISGAAEVDGEIEFADPDLEILVDDSDEGSLDFSLDDDDNDVSEDDLALAEEFGDFESFGDDEEDDEIDLSADLGQFEDAPEDDTFTFEDESDEEPEEEFGETIAMDLPDELADISDLSPPDSADDEISVAEFEPELDDDPGAEPEPEIATVTETEEEMPPPAAEPEDDLDFSSLDMDLDLDLDEEEESVVEQLQSTALDDEYEPVNEMDEELDFELDLGGLSIHDDLK